MAASSSDGVVEAIEDPVREITGIEWHPELDETGVAIYGALVAAAAATANAGATQRAVRSQQGAP